MENTSYFPEIHAAKVPVNLFFPCFFIVQSFHGHSNRHLLQTPRFMMHHLVLCLEGKGCQFI